MFSLSNCLPWRREWPPGRKLRRKADKLAFDYSGRARAEEMYKQALAEMEGSLVADQVELATCLANLGNLYVLSRRYEEALPPLERAQEILEKWRGPESAETLTVMKQRADCCRRLELLGQHIELMERLLAVADKSDIPGPAGDWASILEDLVPSYDALVMREKAEAAYARIVALYEDPGLAGPTANWDLNREAVVLSKAIFALHQRVGHLLALERYKEALPLCEVLVKATDAGTAARKLYQSSSWFPLRCMLTIEKPYFNSALVAALGGLARCLEQLSLAESASRIEGLHLRRVSILREALGVCHEKVVQAKEDLARFFHLRGKRKELAAAPDPGLMVCDDVMQREDLARVCRACCSPDDAPAPTETDLELVVYNSILHPALKEFETTGRHRAAVADAYRRRAAFYWRRSMLTSARADLEQALAHEKMLVTQDAIGSCPSAYKLALLHLWVGDHASGRPLADKALGAP